MTPEEKLRQPLGLVDEVERRWGDGFSVFVRAAPLTVTPSYTAWCLTHPAVEASETIVLAMQAGLENRHPLTIDDIEPYGRGFAVYAVGGRVVSVRLGLAVDSGGVVGIRVQRDHPQGRRTYLAQIRSQVVTPAIRALESVLRQAEVVGRAAWDLSVTELDGWTIEGAVRQPDKFYASSELTVPADADELDVLARRWVREFARELGLAEWEPSPMQGEPLG